jgi:DNA-binding CsgD family transcriptional regulator
MKSTRAAAAAEAIAALTGHVHDPLELLDEVRRRVDSVVPNEGGGWLLTDPQTVLPTGVVATIGDPDLPRRFFEHELSNEDVGTFSEMHRAGETVALLSEVTGGRPELSSRYREIHLEVGLDHEARVMFRTGAATWAMACFGRAVGEPDFDADEREWLRTIAPEVGQGLRAALARRPPEPVPVWAPGMLVLDETGAIEYATGEADRWLAHMPAPGPLGLHPTILGVAMQARAEALAAAPGRGLPAQVRVRVDTGAWLYVHASVLRDADGRPARTAVMLEPADRAQLLPLLADVHGLTARERDVVELLLAGVATDQLAARLHISRHTVRDHVKAVFAKVGVASRPELTALFR